MSGIISVPNPTLTASLIIIAFLEGAAFFWVTGNILKTSAICGAVFFFDFLRRAIRALAE